MGKKSKSDLPETTLENEGDPTPSRVPIFSTDDLVRFTGVSRKTLNRWIHDGLLHPKNGGVGRHIEYSVSDAIAVTAGMHFRDAGFDPGWVAASIRLLSDLGRNVIDEMEAGRTWIAPGAFVVRGGERVYVPGRLVEPPAPEHLAEAQGATHHQVEHASDRGTLLCAGQEGLRRAKGGGVRSAVEGDQEGQEKVSREAGVRGRDAAAVNAAREADEGEACKEDDDVTRWKRRNRRRPSGGLGCDGSIREPTS